MFPSLGFEESFRLVDDFRKLFERITNDDLNKIARNPIRLVEGIKLEPLSSDELETFYQYEEVASKITEASSLDHLLVTIEKAGKDINCHGDKYTEAFTTPSVYMFLPSYSGKTQATLTLDHYSEQPFKFQHPENQNPFFADVHRIKACIHFVITDRNWGRYQRIYKFMSKYSLAWTKELEKDKRALKKFLKKDDRDHSVLTGADLVKAGDQPLKCIGFVFSLLEARINGWDEDYINTGKSLDYEPKTLFEAREFVRKARERLPVVFTLDIFNASSKIGTLLFFARNLLRELGAVVVISGTDASVVNRDDSVGCDRGNGCKKPWAYLITDLPKATFSSLPMDIDHFQSRFTENNFFPFKNWLTRVNEKYIYMACSNPGLLKVFYQELCKFLLDKPEGSCTAVDAISSVLKSSINQVLANKNTLNLENGSAAEFMMCLSQQRIRNSENRQVTLYPGYFTHNHFAVIDLFNGAKPTIYGDSLNGATSLWRETNGLFCDIGDEKFKDFIPSCLFNEFKCDELSYFLLLSLHGFREITKNLNRLSFREVSTRAHATLGMTSSGSSNSQIAEPLTGVFHENTVAGSVIMASHESFEGIQLSSFLRNMICELSDPTEIKLSLTIPEELETALTLKVPYIPCEGLDALCSKEFNQIPNVFTGLFSMTQNQEQCDGILMSRFMFEVENHVKSCGSCLAGLFKKEENKHDRSMNAFHDAAQGICNLTDEQRIEIQCLLSHLKSVGIRPDSNALEGLMKIFVEGKNFKDGLDGTGIEQILRRLVNTVMSDPVYPLVKTHVCIIVTTKFNMKIDKNPADRISDFFKGKVHVAKPAGLNSDEIKLELFHDFKAHQRKPKPGRKQTNAVEKPSQEEAEKLLAEIGMEPKIKRTKSTENGEKPATWKMKKKNGKKKRLSEFEKVSFIPTHEQASKILVVVLPLEGLYPNKVVIRDGVRWGPASG